MKIQFLWIFSIFILKTLVLAKLEDGKILFNRSNASSDADGYYRLSNYDFKCFRQLSICSTHGWSLRFKLRLNQLPNLDRERRYLLFSTGAHEPYGDGMLIYLYQSKNTSYLEFGLKEFRNDQFAYYWQMEAELEVNRWIDVITTIEEYQAKTGKNHRMSLFFDGFLFKETQPENYTEVFIFKYDQIHPKSAVIYGIDSDLALFDNITYYERILTEEEIANVSPNIVQLGCVKGNDRIHEYIMPDTYETWKLCREECFNRRTKIALYFPNEKQCGCIETSYELERAFKTNENCQCSLNSSCSNNDEWYIIIVSNVIDLIDAEVGLAIKMADSSFLTHGRTRVQRNEGVEIIVTVKNERNLASLTVYGDIEGHEPSHTNSSSNEIYITAGVVNLSWKNEGAKKVQFRADYRRMVNNEMAEYRTVYVDVVYVKTDLPIRFLHLSPDNRDSHPYQNFTVQTFGSVPISCTLNYGDGYRQTNGTNRDQYYTAYFARNYQRYGQYNVSIQCYNELSKNTTELIRNIRRENMKRKMIIIKNQMEIFVGTRFEVVSNDDYFFRHANCLFLKNMMTNETMKLIVRKKKLEIIPNDALPIGKHLYQLMCDSMPLQPYLINIQPAIRSLDIEVSKTTIKSGQTIQFSISLEPTVDLTIIFDCGIADTPIDILYIEQITEYAPFFIGNCTYSIPDQYHPLISAFNHINSINQSIRIDVEPALSPFQIEIEDRSDINQLALITIHALENITYEGQFTLTIVNNFHEKNQSKIEHIQLLQSNNFTEYIYMNITTYGRQILNVQGGDPPIIRQAQVAFTIGTEMTRKPQVYVVNSIGLVNEDFIWIDSQWIDGIGFDIQIHFDQEKTFTVRYGQFIRNFFNRTMKINDGIHAIQWKRIAKQHLQIGYRFTKIGTYKITATFIQPSSKLLPVELKCSTVTIVEGLVKPEETCFQEQDFHLISTNALNISNSTSILFLPYSLQHHLEPKMFSKCSKDDFLYSHYLLSLDSSQWKSSRLQRYINPDFLETFLENHCFELSSKSISNIEPKTLSHGYYLAMYTISSSSNPADFRQFSQSFEIIRSDFITTFDGNQTITNDDEEILFDFYLTTIDPDQNDFDRRKMNFTLCCYPAVSQSALFHSTQIPLGSSRPTENNPQNHNSWFTHWSKFNLISRISDLNLHIYEHQCFLSNEKKQQTIGIDSETKSFKINEHDLNFNNGTLYFLLIIRHLIDGRQYIGRFEVEKEMKLAFVSADLTKLEEAMENLDDLAAANPKRAVELISGLADKLNEMSENSTTEDTNEDEVKAMNDRMAAMRSKMLTSMNTVLDSSNDPAMVDKALKASATVTANSDQMPLDNQEKGAGIIEKVGAKVKEMESADENTVTGLASSLMDVGGNVLQAASKTVSKDKGNDPDAVIENLESDMKETENEETDTKVLYAPTLFYESCDECDSLPEDRWEEYRLKLEEEKKKIIEGRERASNIAKRSSGGLFTVGDVLTNRSSSNETKTIESKNIAMTLTKTSPDGKSSLSAGDTSIRLPVFDDLNTDSDSSNVFTKILESKENPYASAHGNSSVQGNVVTIVLSRPDGSEMAVQNTTKPIAIRLNRPIDKQPKSEIYDLVGTTFQYHKVNLPEKQMTLSISILPNSSPMDIYAVYVAFGTNESLLEPPTESKFDLLFVLPNRTVLNSSSDAPIDDQYELIRTVFLPPSVHLGNGTYIFGIRLINTSSVMNLTEYNSSYTITMYVSKCQYWNEKQYVWSSDGCQVGSLTTLKSTECLCTHLTTFGSDFYVPPNTINFKTVFTKFKTLHENAAVFSTVIVIFVLYFLAAIWARRKDKQDLIKWTATPLIDNLPIDTYHYLITVHTGVGKESATKSNISFVISGETTDSGVRKLTDGKIQVCQELALFSKG